MDMRVSNQKCVPQWMILLLFSFIGALLLFKSTAITML